MKADLRRAVERDGLDENDEVGDRERLKALLLFPKRNGASSIAENGNRLFEAILEKSKITADLSRVLVSYLALPQQGNHERV